MAKSRLFTGERVQTQRVAKCFESACGIQQTLGGALGLMQWESRQIFGGERAELGVGGGSIGARGRGGGKQQEQEQEQEQDQEQQEQEDIGGAGAGAGAAAAGAGAEWLSDT